MGKDFYSLVKGNFRTRQNKQQWRRVIKRKLMCTVQKYFLLDYSVCLSLSPLLHILYMDQWRNLLKLQIPAFLQTLRFCFSGSGMKHSR